jgi:hypothetical protein
MIDPEFDIIVHYSTVEDGKMIRANKQFTNLSNFLRWLTTFDEIDAVNITFKFTKEKEAKLGAESTA